MTSTQTSCTACKESQATDICHGCSQHFCTDHLPEYRKTLSQQFHREYNEYRQNISDQKIDPTKHRLIKEIDQWEIDSIEKIKEVAQQCREKWIKYLNRCLTNTEKKLDALAQQINEMDLHRLKQRLQNLQDGLHRTTNVPLKQESTSFINKIFVLSSIEKDTQWKRLATTIAGGTGQGNRLNQFSRPYGICIDDDQQTIYIADCGNARIVEKSLNGSDVRIVAGGNGSGNRTDQLNGPTDVIIDRQDNSFIIADQGNRRVVRWPRQTASHGQVIIDDIDCARLALHRDGSVYVSDCVRNEVRRWKKGERQGMLVAGGNRQGNQLNQLDFPTHLVVDDDHTLYVSDRDNHRVMKWVEDANEGMVVAGGNGRGNRPTQLSLPQGLFVDQFGDVYVADHGNGRVVRWCEGANQGTIVIAGAHKTQRLNQPFSPIGLSSDGEGNLYLSDMLNDRIQKFDKC